MTDNIDLYPLSHEGRSALPRLLSIVTNSTSTLFQAQVAPAATQANDLAQVSNAIRSLVEHDPKAHVGLNSPMYRRDEAATAAPNDIRVFDIVFSDMSRLISSSEPMELLSDLGPKGRAKMLSALDAYCLALADLPVRFSTD